MNTRAVIGLLVVGVTACGESPQSTESPATRAAATPTATAAATEQTPEAEIRQAATNYITGLADQDWSRVCESRAPSERREFAREAGSCEQVFKILLESQPAMGKIMADAKPGEVRIKGAVAGVDIVQPGQTEPAGTLAAVREDGHWFLKDIPESKTP
jgi:hypothetical protein